LASFSAETAAAMAPGPDDRKKSIFDGVISHKSAKGDAARLAIVHPPTGAAVTRDVMLGA
jgi:hypothetical protein